MGRRLSNPKSIKKKVEKILSDPFLFISKLKIKNKKGRLVYLKPNGEQLKLIQQLENSHKHLAVLKGRQIGSSTVVCAYLFWKWITSKDPITVAILSHKLASSKHLLSIWFRFYDNLPQALQVDLIERNSTTMTTIHGASVIAVSGEASGGLRSFTANYIHLSEYAFAPNAEELKATAMASLNEGRLIQESTANVFGDAHHIDLLKAQRGEGNLDYLFFPWSEHTEYRKKISGDFYLKPEEEEVKNRYGLDDNQIAWRREKIEQLGYYKFIREYPLSIDEAYGGNGNAYFDEDCFRYINRLDIEAADDTINYFGDYTVHTAYAIGVDVGAGTGGDPSVIVVMDKTTYEPVCIWSSNRCSVVECADRLEHIAAEYGNCRILVEENAIGSALLNELRGRGYTNLWKHSQTGKDWNTNVKTKFLMFEELKDCLKEGVVTNLDMLTVQELKAYFVNEKGLIKYPDGLPTHGDRVVAMALAIQCLKQVSLPKHMHLPHWIKSRRAERATARYTFRAKNRY